MRRWAAPLLAVAVAGVLFAGTANARPAHATSSRISFYTDLANFINGPNPSPRFVRPAGISLTEDGSVGLGHLRWSSWGGSVARAHGVLSASDCTPNCAEGHRTNRRAQVKLSSPGLELGHRVYRCFQMTVPSHPRANAHECLKRSGALIAYAAVSVSKPRPAYARFFTPSGNIECEMVDNGTSQASVSCDMQKPPAIVQLAASGAVSICQHKGLQCTGNLGDSPTRPRKLSYGHSVRLRRFRCTSAFRGVTCVVRATGKGFFISKQSVRRVG